MKQLFRLQLFNIDLIRCIHLDLFAAELLATDSKSAW